MSYTRYLYAYEGKRIYIIMKDRNGQPIYVIWLEEEEEKMKIMKIMKRREGKRRREMT